MSDPQGALFLYWTLSSHFRLGTDSVRKFFTFLFVHVDKVTPFLVYVTNICTVLFMRLPLWAYPVSLWFMVLVLLCHAVQGIYPSTFIEVHFWTKDWGYVTKDCSLLGYWKFELCFWGCLVSSSFRVQQLRPQSCWTFGYFYI